MRAGRARRRPSTQPRIRKIRQSVKFIAAKTEHSHHSRELCVCVCACIRNLEAHLLDLPNRRRGKAKLRKKRGKRSKKDNEGHIQRGRGREWSEPASRSEREKQREIERIKRSRVRIKTRYVRDKDHGGITSKANRTERAVPRTPSLRRVASTPISYTIFTERLYFCKCMSAARASMYEVSHE